MKSLTNCLRLFLLTSLLSAFNFLAFAASETTIDGIKYSLQDNGTAQVTGIENPTILEITIPATISNGKTEYIVSSINDATFDLCTNLKKATFADGDGILDLGNSISSEGYKNGIFHNCPLEEVHIGRDLDYQYNPFEYSSTLRTATFGNNVKVIPEGLFQECGELTSVALPESLTEVKNYAFRKCSKLAYLAIPPSVKKFGNAVFYGCSNLKKIEISDLAAWCNIDFQYGESNPLSNYSALFLNGKEITDLVIPSTVTEIKQYAFSYCTSIKSIKTGENLKTIGTGAFLSCYNAKSLTIGNDVTSIGNNAFKNCSGFETVEFGENIKSVGNDAFYHCYSLKRVDISNLSGWCEINFSGEGNPLFHAKHLFINNKEIFDLQIPDGVTNIGNYAFYGCSGLTSAYIPASVTEIGTRAFRDCNELIRISIQEGIKKIGTQAFLGCKSLESVEIKSETPPTIAKSTFTDEHYSSTSVLVPIGALDAYKTDQYWTLFSKLHESNFSSVEQNLEDFIKVTTANGCITINGAESNSIKYIYNTNGHIVYSGYDNHINLPAGLYILAIGNSKFKVII